MRASLVTLVALTSFFSACERIITRGEEDAGFACPEGEKLVNGKCRFVCRRDSECKSDEHCDLIVGQCAPRVTPVDAGRVVTCFEGGLRCSTDSKNVEICGADGGWGTKTQCPQPDGFCSNDRCLACRPGVTRCAANTTTVAEVCRPDGSNFRQITCAGTATCRAGLCAECTAGERRCSPDGKAVQECQRTPREDLSLSWVNVGDNFDGTCITQVCQTTSGMPACRMPTCIPGTQQCRNAATLQTCNAVGAYEEQVCSALPNATPNIECQNGACIDECADAARQKSYFGCEYWTTVMDNVFEPAAFKGNVTTGQGAVDSEFAFVVSNRSTAVTTVVISRVFNAAVQTVKTVMVPGRNDPATKGVSVIRVPWQSIADDADPNGVSGRARYAYRITTNRPVTVYQFNALNASVPKGSCSVFGTCAGNGQCKNNQCVYYSFSNDASLLLPAHILGTSYVALTPEHVMLRNTPLFGTLGTGAASIFANNTLSIVATKDNTQVTVKAAARTLASTHGASVPALNAGDTMTFTLASYEVLQLSSDNPAGISSSTTTGNIECAANPYQTVGGALCRVNADLTGSIITSSEPIAVFGGSQCTLRSYIDTACDHVEEQLFPFVTWGQNFVAGRTAPLRLTDNTFASAANAGPDYYKIVAGCPESQCPMGTRITLSTAPAAADVLLGSNGCEAGTSLSANTCRLRGGRFVEFRSKSSFTITADKPIQVAQLFAGQDATKGTVRPSQGDPSLVLLPPVEQWRSTYTVLTAPGIRDNYLGIVVDDARVQTVSVDGTPVTTGFSAIPSTTFKVVNVPVSVGTHTIQIAAKPGQTTLPGAGVTVYGFDEYISYGYTGGLDLGSIVSGINPGG